MTRQERKERSEKAIALFHENEARKTLRNIERVELRNKAIDLFIQGKTPSEIARELGQNNNTVGYLLDDARCALIAQQGKDYYDRKLALFLDENFSALRTMLEKLANSDWLDNTEPKSIREVTRAYESVSNKLLLLLGLASRGVSFVASVGTADSESVAS